MKKTLLFLLLLLFAFTVQSQKKKFFLYGFVKDSLGFVENANVFNLSTKQGTFTDSFGKYEISVSEGDSLKFSSVQHKILYSVVTNFTLKRKYKDIFLERDAITLDEVVVKNTYLLGILALDKKQTPKDKKLDALKDNLDLSKIDMDGTFNEDHISSKVKPPQNNVDPTSLFLGAGASANIAWKYSQKLWALRRSLEYKTNFPALLKKELGDDFFFKELKIPEDRFFHFLEYCNPLNIENLYKVNQLQVIKILKNESVNYIKLISKD